MKKNLSEKQKKLIVKRYLNGETITNLTRKLWSNGKIRKKGSIYNWISKYSNQEKIDERNKNKLKSKKWKKTYHSYDLK